MIVRGLVALAVAMAAGYMLFKDVGADAPPRAVAKLKPPVLTLDEPVDGTLHFTATVMKGGLPQEEGVYRLRRGDARPVRALPEHPRTWGVSAWGDNVVANSEGPRIKFAPAGAVDLVTGRTLAEDAHAPVAGPGGRVAYTGYVQRRSVSAAFVRWSARGRFRPIVRSGIWGMEFLPDGRLVVVQRRNRRAWILVIGPRGVQRQFRVPGNPQHSVFVTRNGLIGFEGGTRTLRLYRPDGRRAGALDVADWLPAGTRGGAFMLVEREGNRIATLSAAGDLDVVGRHDPHYEIYDLEWELTAGRS